MGLAEGETPSFSIQNMTSGVNYVAPEVGEALTDEAIQKFIESVRAGKAKPAWLSEPIPAVPTDENALKRVVIKNFDSEVVEAGTDVLVDWHGEGPKHKALETNLQLAAQSIKDAGVPLKVVQFRDGANADLKLVYGDGYERAKPNDFELV